MFDQNSVGLQGHDREEMHGKGGDDNEWDNDCNVPDCLQERMSHERRPALSWRREGGVQHCLHRTVSNSVQGEGQFRSVQTSSDLSPLSVTYSPDCTLVYYQLWGGLQTHLSWRTLREEATGEMWASSRKCLQESSGAKMHQENCSRVSDCSQEIM